MGKGYPDYFGYSVFPQFGTFKNEAIAVAIAGGATETIIDITNKGKIYSGYIDISITRLQEAFLNLTVDGTTLAYLTPFAMKTRDFRGGLDLPFILSYYDVIAGMCTVVFQTDITFISQYKLEIQNTTAFVANITGNVLWANVV